jgi:RNA polymerase-interacting CarD/CdnL/TRCF family regulator
MIVSAPPLHVQGEFGSEPFMGEKHPKRALFRSRRESAACISSGCRFSASTTMLMIPTSVAEKLGMRCAISQSDIKRLWRILLATPRSLPDRYKDLRYLLQGKLGTGDIFQVAEAVRDMVWRQWKNHLSATAKRLYEEGIRLLVGEIAAARGIVG